MIKSRALEIIPATSIEAKKDSRRDGRGGDAHLTAKLLQLIMATGLIAAIVWHPSCAFTIQFAGDWVCNVGQLFLLLLEIFAAGRRCVLLEPVGRFFHGLEDLSERERVSKEL
jgi:hypothetical protein